MSRFDLDLTEISDKRAVVPKGDYRGKIAGGSVRTGATDSGNWAMLNVTIAIKDNEVSKILNQDEPKMFFSGFLAFDKETGKFNKNGSPEFGQLLKVTGFTNISDFEEGTESAETEFDYIVKVVENILEAAKGVDVLAKVTQAKDQNGDTVNRVSKLASLG